MKNFSLIIMILFSAPFTMANTCMDFTNWVLRTERLGTFKKPIPEKSYRQSSYKLDDRYKLPVVHVQAEEEKRKALPVGVTSGLGSGLGQDYVVDPTTPKEDSPLLWHLAVTDSQDQEAPMIETYSAGYYYRDYIFQVVDSQCRLKKIVTSFAPAGSGGIPPKMTFDAKECRRLAGNYRSTRQSGHVDLNSRDITRGAFCDEVLPYFGE